MTWYTTQNNVLLAQFKKTLISNIPNKAFSSFIHYTAWRYEIESVKNYIFGFNRIFNFFKGFNDCPDLAVDIDAELGNLMEITVFDGKTVEQAVIPLYKQECNQGTCLVFS